METILLLGEVLISSASIIRLKQMTKETGCENRCSELRKLINKMVRGRYTLHTIRPMGEGRVIFHSRVRRRRFDGLLQQLSGVGVLINKACVRRAHLVL